jgi:hypothetical protein
MGTAGTGPAFELPPVDQIANMSVQVIGERKLLPTDIVICINRGNRVLKDTFDGEHREIPPGFFRTEYGAAMHFQRRQIVPGTRNLEVGGYVSYIGILGSEDGRIKVDQEENCQKFTDDELQAYGERIEAIDRGSEKMDVVRTSVARAGVRGQGSSQRPMVDAREQANEDAAAAAAEVFAPPTESETRAAEADAASEGVAAAPTPRRRR